jgi:hypothetical protein
MKAALHMNKFGNCPYCYGISILLAAFFLAAFIIAAALAASLIIYYTLLLLFLFFFTWACMHAWFFIKRMSAVIQPLSFSPIKAAWHICKVTVGFSISSVKVVLGIGRR